MLGSETKKDARSLILGDQKSFGSEETKGMFKCSHLR